MRGQSGDNAGTLRGQIREKRVKLIHRELFSPFLPSEAVRFRPAFCPRTGPQRPGCLVLACALPAGAGLVALAGCGCLRNRARRGSPWCPIPTGRACMRTRIECCLSLSSASTHQRGGVPIMWPCPGCFFCLPCWHPQWVALALLPGCWRWVGVACWDGCCSVLVAVGSELRE